MRTKLQILPLAIISLLLVVLTATSCEDDLSPVGSSLASGEVNITVDTTIFNLNAVVSESQTFDSKSGTLLLGNLESPDYGKITCSFVTRFMCTPTLNLPDSLFTPERVDSCKFFLIVNNNELTGDSLSPQKVAVYKLNRQLPSDINNLFDPEGYYDNSTPLGERSFIVANIASKDSTQEKRGYVSIDVPLNPEFGKQIFEKYKTDPGIFEWPQTLTSFLPGFYVKQTFGKGCVANIGNAYVAVYYHTKVISTTINGTDTIKQLVNRRDSVLPFIVSPEVLSSNNVSYSVAESIKQKVEAGEVILTTPCGYSASFRFPIEDIIKKYQSSNNHLSTVSDLLLSIPYESISSSDGIGVAPNLLLVKTNEIENFFSQNKVPDGKTSFTATLNEESSWYNFSSLREYFLKLLNQETISEADLDFTIIPVEISYETVQGYYGNTTYVTKCVPYTAKPSVTKLLTDKARIVFSFSSQIID